jgi:excisionase family DNA binding protein
MLTRSQVCARLRIGKNRFHELVKTGELAAIRTGSAPNSPYKVTEEALAEYIERSAVKPVVRAS